MAAVATFWAVVCVGIGGLGVPNAGAHDELVSSSPAANATLEQSLDRVELTFRGTPMNLGATVIVADAAGKNWADGAPSVSGSNVGIGLVEALPDGNYQTRWRVVSQDGAVISGSFDFSVGEASSMPAVQLPTNGGTTQSLSPSRARSRPEQGDFDLAGASGQVSTQNGGSSATAPSVVESALRTAVAALIGAFGGFGLISAVRTRRAIDVRDPLDHFLQTATASSTASAETSTASKDNQ